MEWGSVLWKKNWVKLPVVSVAVVLGLKYMFTFLGPFLPALLFVLLLNPLFERIHRRLRIPKGIQAGIVLVAVAVSGALLISYLYEFISRCISDLYPLLEGYWQQILLVIEQILHSFEEDLALKPGTLEEGLKQEMALLWRQLRLVFGREAVGISYSYLEKGGNAVLYVTFLVIGTLLLAKDYDRIHEKLSGFRFWRSAERIGRRLKNLFGIYLKAQGIILLCIVAVCCTGLWVLGIKGAWAWGIAAGLLDVLPFIGAGIVLVPLGILAAFFGNFWALPGCVVLFAATTLIRHLLEPKLVGERINIYPVVLLFSVFVGIQVFHVGGIILGPVALFIIKEVYKELRDA